MLERIEPEPGFGMVTLYVADARDDAPEALIVPIGSLRRIELRTAPERAESFGFERSGAEVDEQGRDEQGHHVERDVAAGDPARRVPVRDPEPGSSRAHRHVPIDVP